MTEFSTGERTAVEQRVFCGWLASKFDAVEVTGLEGWERIKKVYAGLAEGENKQAWHAGGPRQKVAPSMSGRSPSVSPKQDPLFPDMEDAA